MENASTNLLGIIGIAINKHREDKMSIKLEYYIRQKVTEFISRKFEECFEQTEEMTYECVIELWEKIIK